MKDAMLMNGPEWESGRWQRYQAELTNWIAGREDEQIDWDSFYQLGHGALLDHHMMPDDYFRLYNWAMAPGRTAEGAKRWVWILHAPIKSLTSQEEGSCYE